MQLFASHRASYLRAALGALLLVGGTVSATAGAPDTAACRDYADTFVELAPGLDGQTGVATGDELLASADRWPLVVTGYTYAAERVERHDTSGPWGQLVRASDGLINCFSVDPDRAGGEMERLKKDFDALFPKQRRKALLAQAKG